MSRTFSYLHDANGNRTRLTWNDGFWVGYETDGLNRVTAIREYGSTLLVSYGYDAQRRDARQGQRPHIWLRRRGEAEPDRRRWRVSFWQSGRLGGGARRGFQEIKK